MSHSNSELYPLLFLPVLKDYIWGGRNLELFFGRNLPDGVTAESWETAAHRDGTSIVTDGVLAGNSLTEIHTLYGLDLIGRNSIWAQERNRFPLLVKILDAQQRLSVQVHPDDVYALAHENDDLGKSEMWVILHAEPGAQVILGVTTGTVASEFGKAIETDQLPQYLHHIDVSAGDFICVPSGSLHAILGGIVLAEIQQNSNATYRVYDWGRDPRDRPLHIEKALDVINFEQVEPMLPTPRMLSSTNAILREKLCDNSYFTVERFHMLKGSTFRGYLNGDTFEIWGILEGDVNLQSKGVDISLSAIRFTLLPATTRDFTINATTAATALRVYVE
jgi:mannose-6-phosphate isomerase